MLFALNWFGLSFVSVCVSLVLPALCLRCFTSPKVGNIYACSFLWEFIVLALTFRSTLYVQSIFKCGMRKRSSLSLCILRLLVLLFTNSCLLSSHSEALACAERKTWEACGTKALCEHCQGSLTERDRFSSVPCVHVCKTELNHSTIFIQTSTSPSVTFPSKEEVKCEYSCG